MVEVLTSASRYPSRDWLSFVKTTRARSKIRHWLNTEQNKRSMEIGRRLLERELRRYKVSLKKLLESDEMPGFLESEGIGKVEGHDEPGRLWQAPAAPGRPSGSGGAGASARRGETGRIRQAVSRILPFGSSPITVSGQGDLLAYLAKCCSPTAR